MGAAWVVVGLVFGDEGKGSVVDALVRRSGARTVVRFNGGAQAAHNVVTGDRRHHTFSQFGSGTLAGASTVLTKDVVVDPAAMRFEAEALSRIGVVDPLRTMMVDSRALVSTVFHAAMSKVREYARGAARHGSCGVGVGEAVRDSVDPGVDRDALLHVYDLKRLNATRWRVRSLRQAKAAEALRLLGGAENYDFGNLGDAMEILNSEEVEERVAIELCAVAQRIRIADWDEVAGVLRGGSLVYEGAQGVLLDEWHGFHPHTTWSTTTADNARAAHVSADSMHDLKVVGVLRAYGTRHGEGPFPGELTGVPKFPGEHNHGRGQQGRFRMGMLDLVLARYAIAVARPDALALTCLDHPNLGTILGYGGPRGWVRSLVPRYEKDLDAQERLGEYLRTLHEMDISRFPPATLVKELGLPLMLTSAGPRAEDKTWGGLVSPG